MLRQATCVRSAQAGIAYAAVVFALGFAFGTVRVLLLVPRVGATLAVLMEAPLMLAASWWVSRRCTQYFSVEAAAAARIVMGAVAFTVLMTLELALALLVFARTPAEYLASFQSAAGAVGLAAQVCFATFPFAQRRASLSADGSETTR